MLHAGCQWRWPAVCGVGSIPEARCILFLQPGANTWSAGVPTGSKRLGRRVVSVGSTPAPSPTTTVALSRLASRIQWKPTIGKSRGCPGRHRQMEPEYTLVLPKPRKDCVERRSRSKTGRGQDLVFGGERKKEIWTAAGRSGIDVGRSRRLATIRICTACPGACGNPRLQPRCDLLRRMELREIECGLSKQRGQDRLLEEITGSLIPSSSSCPKQSFQTTSLRTLRVLTGGRGCRLPGCDARFGARAKGRTGSLACSGCRETGTHPRSGFPSCRLR